MSYLLQPEVFEASPGRQLARQLIESGLAAINTDQVVRRVVRLVAEGIMIQDQTFPLHPESRLWVVGVGKCAMDAAIALEAQLGERIKGGVVIDLRSTANCPLTRIACFQGDHPFPTERNIDATSRMIDLLKQVTEQDLVLVIVSGGGSTLLCQPEQATCQDERAVVEALFRAGATIQEINLLRRHLSRARGGWLAQYAYPARVVSLIFSDVPGNELSSIASGPTIFDETTLEQAWAISERYHLPEQINFRRDWLLETPKDKNLFTRASHFLLVANRLALTAMQQRAQAAGYTAEIVTDNLTGEAAAVAAALLAEQKFLPPRSVRLYGGETTVTLRGDGRGGRNQELALAALKQIAAAPPAFDGLIISLASDGRDNSDVAGAICDKMSLAAAQAAGLAPEDYLARNDSFTFFQQIGAQIVTGATGANVSDLIISLKE